MPSINKTPNIGLSQWQGNEYIKRQDVVNDNAAVDAAIGNRTIDDTKVPVGDNHSSLSTLLSWMGNMIKSITGKSNWRTAPVKSIEQLNNDIVAHEAEISSLQNEVQNTLSRSSVSLSNTAPVQSFTADVAGPVGVEFTAPEMVVNLLGRDGDCEDISKWSQGNGATAILDSTNKVFGNNGFKMTTTSATVGTIYKSKSSLNVDDSKYYLFSAYLKNKDTVNMRLLAQGSEVLSSMVTDTNNFIRVGLKLNPSQVHDTSYFHIHCAVTAVGQGGYVDGIMLNEITADEYNNLSVDQILAKYPYINSIQPFVNPMVKVLGKNILPLFTDGWNFLNSSVARISDTRIRINSATLYQYAEAIIPIKSSTQYTFSLLKYGSGRSLVITSMDKDRNIVATHYNNSISSSPTITTANNAVYLQIKLMNNWTSTDVYFDKPQLEEGTTATTYEPHKKSSIILSGEFCKIGSYADTVKLDNGVAKKMAAVKKVILDGRLSFTYGADLTGVKYFTSTLPLTSAGLSSAAGLLGQKHDGKILIPNGNPTSGDCIVISSSDKVTFGITVNDTDSGFGETYTPTTVEMQALMNGWKMNNGTFGTLYNGTGTKTWITWNATSNTGAVTIVPTTKAPGWTGWATLWYAIANPVEEIIDAIGSLGCFEGQNTVSVETGMAYEKANPILDGVYHINNTIIPNTQLSRKTNRIMAVYKNGVLDANWITINDSKTYGKDRLYCEVYNYSLTAEYYVLYQILPEEYNNQQISLTAYYPSNLREAHNALAETVTNMGKELSNVWIELLPLADKEIAMAAIANLTTSTNTDLQNKINEILNIW